MIIFDLVLATRRSEMTGIERYGVNLFKAMLARRPDTKAFVLGQSRLNGPGVLPVTNAMNGWLNLPALAAREARGQAVTIVCPSYPASPLFYLSKHKLIRIVHDCFPWTRNDGVRWQGKILFRSIEEMMIRRYDIIAATTEIVREECEALFHRDTVCCGNAPGLDLGVLAPTPVKVLKAEAFVLAVGTVEPRKNYDALIDLVQSWRDAPFVFVIAGRPGWGDVVGRIEAEEKRNPKLVWLRHASDSEMAWLYDNCACFVTFSHAEGFNMPLVEAGIMGCPIICSDLPIHRAVAAPWAHFLSQIDDKEALWATLKRASSGGRKNAEEYRRRFGWPEIARKIAAVADAI